MPRENSFTDSEGRSLTPDLSEREDEEEPIHEHSRPSAQSPALVSPTYSVQSPIANGAVRSPGTGLNGLTALHILSPSKKSLQKTSPVYRSPGPFTTAWSRLGPKDKFRAAARRVMAMQRSTTLLTTGGRAGAEPGVDPRRKSADLLYSHIHEECVIEIIDYSAVSCSVGFMTNNEFIGLMADENASRPEPWVKVRWINIAGISWDVIKALSIKYASLEIHPLALEDVFHTRSQTRSKADYYMKHLFLRVLCHELNGQSESRWLTGKPRSSSPEPLYRDNSPNLDEKLASDDGGGSRDDSYPQSRQSTGRRMPLLPTHWREARQPHNKNAVLSKLLKAEKQALQYQRQQMENKASLEALKKGESINVKVSPMFIFLFRNGTVISLSATPNLDFTAPISQRLRQADTVLKTTADPSLLVHSLLDLIVDKALDVVDEYRILINRCERDILLKPHVKHVRQLHILSGDLILHKRTLEPIKTMIYGLRRYDIDRCAALVDTSNPANEQIKIVGFMSHKAKIYLADVFDHMDYILSSLNMYAGIAENLIDYTFNISSHEMNEVMRRLTLATIIFLPLTLLTGYFGMNFEAMWSVNKHSDLLFWEIAIPVMAVVIPIFIWPDLQRMAHYIKKRAITQPTSRASSLF
ncbi:hypothetical protein AMATHDRAFT_48399 [Amanita thiersii Skay4041]|uniref:Magnesium transport protein CorA n=1 Tax=Amanita thiersii Skay4041 TaxID=703135 RepID=A0A2A9NQ31_9AGAR|nr:hypothetical protein AMATHDRAFT_48399 [Amanita thiersii Skay4041]